MPVPTHIFDPPFNIIRCSHAVLDVTDLGKSRAFYETTVGLHVEDADDRAVYLRGSEEHQHHSLVLRKAPVAEFSSFQNWATLGLISSAFFRITS